MKLKKIMTESKEEVKDVFEDAVEQSEVSKKNMEDVMKERGFEESKTSDIDEVIKLTKIEVPVKNKFNIVENYLKESKSNFITDGSSFRVKVPTRKDLGTLVGYLKENKVSHSIKKKIKENYRYVVTIYGPTKLKESKLLNEQVSDDAYEIADEMVDTFNFEGKGIYTRDEVDEQFTLAIRQLFGIDDIWEVTDEDGVATINGKEFDMNDLEMDVRGILGYSDWPTIFEGEFEGGVSNIDFDSTEGQILRLIKEDTWFEKNYPIVRDYLYELIYGSNVVDDTMTIGELCDLLNGDSAKSILGESLKESKEVKLPKTVIFDASEVALDSDDEEKVIKSMKDKHFTDYGANNYVKAKRMGLDKWYDPYVGNFGFDKKDYGANLDKINKWADENDYYGIISQPADVYVGDDYLDKSEDGQAYFLTNIWDGGYDEDEHQHIIRMPKHKYEEGCVKESLVEKAKGIKHNPKKEKHFEGVVEECEIKEDTCPKCGKQPCECEKEEVKECDEKPMNEELKILVDLSDYKPWSGAISMWDEIEAADKVDELEFMLEDIYPDGITMVELNDILWFEQDWVREQLGLFDVEEDEDFEESMFNESKKGTYYFVEDDGYGQHGIDIEEVKLTKEEFNEVQKTRTYNGKKGFITNSYSSALYYVQD